MAATNPIGNPGNPWSVSVKPHKAAEAGGTVQVYHGIGFGFMPMKPDTAGFTATGSTTPVGRITNWNPQVYNREVIHTYELATESYGRPVGISAGRSTGYTVALTRMEVWKEEAEIAFGYGTDIWEDLMDQDRPGQADEALMRGSNLYRHWRYVGAYFTELNDSEYDAEAADPRRSRTGSFTFVRRKLMKKEITT